MTYLISLKNVSKNFVFNKKNYEVLKEVNLDIKQGESISIVGPSGSGKSTLLKLMGLLDVTTSGTIAFNNMDFTKINESKKTVYRGEFIGFIFQSYNLLPDFNALDNVILPQSILGVRLSEATARAKELFRELNIDNKFNNYPNQLSGGEQQRVAIARSLINKPKLILADEPTGNLDAKNTKNISRILEMVSKKHKVATVIVTHDMSIAKIADKIYSLSDGNLQLQK